MTIWGVKPIWGLEVERCGQLRWSSRESLLLRCGCWLRNPLIRNQTLAAPDFLRDSRSGPRFLKILPANQHEKSPKTEKCHEIGPSGSDFDENLCGRRYFSWRIFLGGSRLDPANLKIRKNKKFSGDTRAPPRFLKIARPFKKFG